MKYWLVYGVAVTVSSFAAPFVDAQQGQPDDSAQTQTDTQEEGEDQRIRRLRDSLTVDPEAEWVPSVSAPSGPGLSELERILLRAGQAVEAKNLIGPSNGNALSLFQQALALDANNQSALDGIQDIAQTLVDQAQQLQSSGDREGALRLLDRVRGFRPNFPNLDSIQGQISGLAAIQELVDQAEAQLAAGTLDQPADDNALLSFRQVLQLDGDHVRARQGLEEIESALLEQAAAMAGQGDFAAAEAIIERAEAVQDSPSDAVAAARTQVLARRDAAAQSLQEQVLDDIQAGRLEQAATNIRWLSDNGYVQNVADLRQRLQDAVVLRNYFPGAEVRDDLSDGSQGPPLVVIANGSFTMGSPRSQAGRSDNEGPQRQVQFRRPFAITLTEVTVGQFGRFVAATDYLGDAEKNGQSTVYDLASGNLTERAGVSWRNSYSGQTADDDLPVIHVSWNDAQAYADWLAQETGQPYRLPSEAEFEYALRAGSSSIYWWGDRPPSDKIENLTGDRDRVANRWEWPNAFRRYGDGHWGPAPVATYPSNPFGLHDMGGNTMEWVADCYRPDLSATATDGMAYMPDDCTLRAIRGGSWANPPALSRSAYRSSARPNRTSCLIGFRLARDL